MIKSERIKIWGYLFSLFLLVLFTPFKVNALQGVSLVGEGSVSPGATVKYNVVLNANEATTVVTGFNTTVTYDSNVLTLNSVELGTNWTGNTESIPSGKTISFKNGTGAVGQTTVATFVFKVSLTATANSATISLKSTYSYKDVDGSDTIVGLEDFTKKLTVKSSDNTLKALKVNGVMVEGFSPNIYEYDINVESSVEQAKILATPNSTKATFAPNSGNRTVDLMYGSNVVTVVVNSESGVAQTYTLNITREDTRSTDTTLSSITVDGIAIPNFKSSIYKYTVKKYKTEGVIIVGTPNDEKATVKVVPPANVIVGENTYLLIVTSENGDFATYTVVINNIDTPISKKLKNLSIPNYDIDFDKNNNRYEIRYDKKKMENLRIYFTTVAGEDEVTAVLSPDVNNDPEAKANLKPGDVITITVTGIDDESSEYTIVIVEDTRVSFFLVLELFIITILVIIIVIVYTKRKKNAPKTKKTTNKTKKDSKGSKDSKTTTKPKKKKFSIYEDEYEEVEVEVEDDLDSDTKELSAEDLNLK